MYSILTVVTPAADRNLLTIEELREAVGATDTSQDASLTTIGLRVSDMIASACNVKRAGINIPTLRSEVLLETFRFQYSDSIILSRTPVTEITTITELFDSNVLATTEYELDAAAGIVYGIENGHRSSWYRWGTGYGEGLSVLYTAGWATVPNDLKAAAMLFVNNVKTYSGRDGSLKVEEIQGVIRREWWVEPTKSTTGIPDDVMDLLVSGGYVYNWYE
jgi:hypothetical protein